MGKEKPELARLSDPLLRAIRPVLDRLGFRGRGRTFN